jgi:uncharacterized protein Usg
MYFLVCVLLGSLVYQASEYCLKKVRYVNKKLTSVYSMYEFDTDDEDEENETTIEMTELCKRDTELTENDNQVLYYYPNFKKINIIYKDYDYKSNKFPTYKHFYDYQQVMNKVSSKSYTLKSYNEQDADQLDHQTNTDQSNLEPDFFANDNITNNNLSVDCDNIEKAECNSDIPQTPNTPNQNGPTGHTNHTCENEYSAYCDPYSLYFSKDIFPIINTDHLKNQKKEHVKQDIDVKKMYAELHSDNFTLDDIHMDFENDL